MTPERWIGPLGISTPTAVWQSPVALEPVVPRFSTFPRRLDTTAHRFTISGDAPADPAVLVSHRANRYASFDVVAARADGKDIAPLYLDVTTAIFRATAARGGTVHWDIDVRAAPDYVDVLTFASL